MMASHESVQCNGQQISNIMGFVERKINLDRFGLRRLSVFDDCKEEDF